MEQLTHIKQAFKQRMEQLYGDRLAKVLLYGSYARGDFHEESDIDFMVVLKDEQLSPAREIFNISDASHDLNLLYDFWISVIPTSLEKFNNYPSAFYQNVRKDSIAL